jgi:pyruvate/2-oxoacid:ferredoxin oxidoreductase alpha subunit
LVKLKCFRPFPTEEFRKLAEDVQAFVLKSDFTDEADKELSQLEY